MKLEVNSVVKCTIITELCTINTIILYLPYILHGFSLVYHGITYWTTFTVV